MIRDRRTDQRLSLASCHKEVAFVLGLDQIGYAIVRSLTRAGVPHVGIPMRLRDFGQFSRYCKALRRDPLLMQEERLCQKLIEWRSGFDANPVLFAGGDKSAVVLAKYRDKLSKYFQFHWVTSALLSRMVDKAQMSRVCQEAGVRTPHTYVTRPDDDLRAQASNFPFPCLIKPARNFDNPLPFEGKKNFVAFSPKELQEFYGRNPGFQGTTIWQQIIEGEDDDIFQCTALIQESGDIGALASVRKIHQYPKGFGKMVFGRTEENTVVVSEALKLLRFVGYRGIASLEFKYQPKDGNYYFIEVNPRLPWYGSLFMEAGVNLPYLAYLDLTGKTHDEAFKTVQRNDVYWISLRKEPARLMSLLQWLPTLATRTRAYDWFDWLDPVPFLLSTIDLFIRAGQMLKRVVSSSLIKQKSVKADANKLAQPS
jgi:D-aspartate ligase